MQFDRINRTENVGPGKTAIITPGLNATYDKIILLHGGDGILAADLTEVRGYANGAEFFIDTGEGLLARQTYLGVDTDTDESVIDFTEPGARNGMSEQLMSSVPANLLKQFRFEVDIANAQGGGEDFSLLRAAAEYRGPTQNPFILKRRRFNFAAAGAGDIDVFLPSGVSGGIIKRVWLHENDKVTAAMLRVGSSIQYNFRTRAEAERIQERNGKVPQAGIFVVDFVVDGNLSGALNTAAFKGTQGSPEVQLTLSMSGAQACVGYIDYIDPLGRLV